MGYLRNSNARILSYEKRRIRFSVLTVNPIVRRKKSHDSEVTKYRDKVDERYSRYNRIDGRPM